MAKKTKAVVGLRRRGTAAPSILTSRNLRLIERRYRVACLRRDGYNLYEIAQTVGFDIQTVRADLQAMFSMAIKETNETTEENRQLQIERLDNLIKTYTPLATEHLNREVIDRTTGQPVIVIEPPNPMYANLILNIEARRAKLLALDVPEVKKLEITGVREYVGIDVESV